LQRVKLLTLSVDHSSAVLVECDVALFAQCLSMLVKCDVPLFAQCLSMLLVECDVALFNAITQSVVLLHSAIMSQTFLCLLQCCTWHSLPHKQHDRIHTDFN